MSAKVLEPRRPNCITVMPRNHEGGQLHDARGLESMRLQQRDDVGEDLIRLLLDGRRRRAIRSNTDLPREEDELRAFGDSDRVAVKTKWSMHPCRI